MGEDNLRMRERDQRLGRGATTCVGRQTSEGSAAWWIGVGPDAWTRQSPPAGWPMGSATLAPADFSFEKMVGRGGSSGFVLFRYVSGTKRYNLSMAVGNYHLVLRSYRARSWVELAARDCLICTYRKLPRLEKLASKKSVWFRFCGCSREVGSKSSTKHTLRLLMTANTGHWSEGCLVQL
jgi:hypothetical protein